MVDLVPVLTAPQLQVLTTGLVGASSSGIALYLLFDKVRGDRRDAAAHVSWSNLADYSVNAPADGLRPSRFRLRNTGETAIYEARLRVRHRGGRDPKAFRCRVTLPDASAAGGSATSDRHGWHLEALLTWHVEPDTVHEVSFRATDDLLTVLEGFVADTAVGVEFRDAKGRTWMRMANGRLADLRGGRDRELHLATGGMTPPARWHVLRRRALRRS